ncbi:MAG: ABC transporter substrate-binding protein [Anaerolineales bacterium]
MKRLIVRAMLMLSLVLLGACAGPTNTPTEIGAMEVPATEAPSSVPPQTLTITDALGRTVEFDSPPQRIVVAGRATPLLADAVYLFPEAFERVIGIEARFQSQANLFYPLINPTYDQMQKLEKNASAEQILPLEPDVVIMKTFMAESLGEPLEQVDVPVVYLELETPEQYTRDITTLGQLFANADRAQEIIDFYNSRQELVAELVNESSAEPRPNVLLAQYSEQDGEVSVEVPSASWLQTRLVEMAGGEPVWREAAPSGGWTVVGFEQIGAWDPQKIFIIHYVGDSSQTADTLAENENWAALRAVQNGELYGFPADYLSWDQPDTRWILGLQWLATKINPELASEIDVMAQVEAFYSQLYGLDQETFELEIRPNLKGDLP